MNFIVNAMPKSASSYAVHLLHSAFGLERAEIGLRGRHFLMDEHRVAAVVARGVPTVSHAHLRGYSFHRQCIAEQRLKGVLLIRPLVESVVSLTEWIGTAGAGFFDESAFFTRRFQSAETSMEARFDAVIDFCLPWYLAFVKEWEEHGGAAFMRADYRQVTLEPRRFIQRFGERFGLDPVLDDTGLQAAIGERKNFNSGQADRWRRMLDARQEARIKAMAAFYDLDALVYDTDAWIAGEA